MIPAPIPEDRQNFSHLADSNSEVGSISTGVNQASIVSGEGIGRTRRLRQRDAPRLAGKWISAGIYQGPVQQVVGRVGEAKGELGGGWREVCRCLAQAVGIANTATPLRVGSVDWDRVLDGLPGRVRDGDPNGFGTVVLDSREGGRSRASQGKNGGCSRGDDMHDDDRRLSLRWRG